GAVLLILALGCAGAKPPQSGRDAERQAVAREEPARPERAGAPGGRPDAVGEAGAQANEPAEQVQRKIIYTAHIELLVEDFDATVEKLTGLVKSQKGAYIAKSDAQGSLGSSRQG